MSLVGKVCRCAERGLRFVEPFLAFFAVVLVLLAAYVFFTSIIFQIVHTDGPLLAGVHVLVALFLLFNVLFNHGMCVFTKPGSTLDYEVQVLQSAMTFDWHWCRKCARPKPPCSHHCSLCNKCILKLDHHCVWMANCIGFYNYRFFLLYLFYMWAGSLYSAVTIYRHAHTWLFDLDGGSRHAWLSARRHKHTAALDPTVALLVSATPSSSTGLWSTAPGSVLPFVIFTLACSVFLALCVLGSYHVWLVSTGQGTIDCLQNRADAQEAKSCGVMWKNPYDLGVVGNWRDLFDNCGGPCWWLTWAWPSTRLRRGCGYALPRRRESPTASQATDVWP